MNCKEIENRKKVSKEMEEKLLKTMKQKQWNKNNETKTMKQKHLKRLSVAQYINDMQLTGKEKACLLGSMKNFEQLRRTYVKKSSNCQLLLEVSWHSLIEFIFKTFSMEMRKSFFVLSERRQMDEKMVIWFFRSRFNRLLQCVWLC